MQILNKIRLLTQSHNAKQGVGTTFHICQRGDVALSFTSPAVSVRAETEKGPGVQTSSGERGGAGEPDR